MKREAGLDLAVGVLLFGAALYFFLGNYQFLQVQVLPATDEGSYYGAARGIWGLKLPEWSWSPGYALVYALFANPLVKPGTALVSVHFFLLSANMLLFYAFLRGYCGRILAFFFSMALGFSPILIPSATAHSFASLYLVVLLILLQRERFRLAAAMLAAGATVRPEFLLLSMLAIALLHRSGKISAAELGPAGAVYGIVALLVIFSDHSVRGSMAFTHHYAWTAKDLGWQGNQFSECAIPVRRDFGQYSLELSMLDYFKLNPRAFLGHMRHNLAILIPNLWEGHNFWVLPGNADFKSMRFKPGIVAPLLALLLGWLKLEGRGSVNEKTAFALKVLGIALLAEIIPWTLIRPQLEYVAAVRPVTLGLLAWACQGLMVKKSSQSKR